MVELQQVKVAGGAFGVGVGDAQAKDGVVHYAERLQATHAVSAT